MNYPWLTLCEPCCCIIYCFEFGHRGRWESTAGLNRTLSTNEKKNVFNKSYTLYLLFSFSFSLWGVSETLWNDCCHSHLHRQDYPNLLLECALHVEEGEQYKREEWKLMAHLRRVLQPKWSSPQDIRVVKTTCQFPFLKKGHSLRPCFPQRLKKALAKESHRVKHIIT